MSRPSVFISYSHGNEEHTQRVHGLAASLARDGCTYRLDIHKDTGEDWPTWTKRQIIEADIILCVVTATYKRRFDDQELPDVGQGVGWEAGLIRHLLYERKLHNDRILPVFFDPANRRHIPLELQGYDAFSLDGPDGYELLLRKLLDRPRYKRPASGSAPDLPVHTIAPRFPRPGGDEYATETDNLLVRILDHTEQLARIRKLLEDGDNDRVIALVEACSEDWPSYLADHVHLEFGSQHDRDLKEAVSLRLGRFDDAAFREALLEVVPGAARAGDEADRQALVRDWINGACLIKGAGLTDDADLRVLYIPVALERYGHHLPQIIRGAHATLDGLGRFAPGSRVLVLFGCIRNGERPPLLWQWLYRRKLTRLGCCHVLPPMGLLHKPDIDDWHAGFPAPLLDRYNRDWLKTRLLGLFPPDDYSIRYERIRRCLIDQGALQRARCNP